jgi:hypothetical protein
VLRLEREVLPVGQLVVAAVRLVRRRDDDALDAAQHAARLEQAPGSAHVGFPRAERRAVRGADDGLRCEVEDVLDLVLAQYAKEGVVVGQVGEGDHAALLDALAAEAGVGLEVAP